MSLPAGTVVWLGHDVGFAGDGSVLLGGSPTVALRLTPLARGLFEGRELTVTDAGSGRLARQLLASGLAHPLAPSLPLPDDCLTVVIPVRDRAVQLARLLRSLPPGQATLVVDDASEDPAAIAAVASEHGAELLRLSANRGPAGARNAGLSRVCTPLVAFIDSDVLLTPGCLETLRRHLADPQLSLVAPRIRALAPEPEPREQGVAKPPRSHPARGGMISGATATASAVDSWLSAYEREHSALDLGPHPGPLRPRSALAWVPSACLMARVSALGHGFDEALRFGEDVDLVWRVLRSGGGARYAPEAVALHEHRTATGPWLRTRFDYGTSAAPLALRHPGHLAPAIIAPWAAAALGCLAAQRRWSVPAAALALGYGVVRIRRRWPLNDPTDRAIRQALRLAARGLRGSWHQLQALITRHWWPLSVLACLFSRRGRRLVLAAAVLDAVRAYADAERPGHPVAFVAARRLDDLAYGAGVWVSAWRHQTAAPLLPDLLGGTGRSRESTRGVARSTTAPPTAGAGAETDARAQAPTQLSRRRACAGRWFHPARWRWRRDRG